MISSIQPIIHLTNHLFNQINVQNISSNHPFNQSSRSKDSDLLLPGWFLQAHIIAIEIWLKIGKSEARIVTQSCLPPVSLFTCGFHPYAYLHYQASFKLGSTKSDFDTANLYDFFCALKTQKSFCGTFSCTANPNPVQL